MGIIDDGDDGLSFGVVRACFVNKTGFAFCIIAECIELESLAEKAQQVGPSVE